MLTLDDDDPLWHLSQRCRDWWFGRAQESVMMPASVDGDDEDVDDADDNNSVCASGFALSSV